MDVYNSFDIELPQAQNVEVLNIKHMSRALKLP